MFPPQKSVNMSRMSENSYRILLVDDEERIQRALARRLVGYSPNWEVITATSGIDALKMLEEQPVDLVVSDLQMPLMDGGIFLSKVRELYPQTIRFALSGHAQQKLMLKAISLAHQYFSKPCDSMILAKAIESALSDADRMGEAQIREILVRINQFAPMSEIFKQLEQKLQDSSASLSDISDIIVQDPAITAKVLQVANSSFFGAGQKISVLEEAVGMLGVDSIRSLIAVFTVLEEAVQQPYSSEIANRVWKHSLEVSHMAQEIAHTHLKRTDLDGAISTLAILHDLGVWLLADQYQEKYELVINSARANETPMWFAEKNEFGVSHAEVGAMLFNLWGLPESLVEMVLFHHQPSLANSSVPAEIFACVHIADILDQGYHSASESHCCISKLDKDYLEKLNLPTECSYWQEWGFKYSTLK